MQEQRPHRTRQIAPSPGARRSRLAGDSRAARVHAQMQSRRDWRLQPDERPTAIWQISRADDGAEPNEAILPSLMGRAGRRPACAAVLKPRRIGTARASSGSPASAEAAFSGQIGSGQYRSRLPNHQRGALHPPGKSRARGGASLGAARECRGGMSPGTDPHPLKCRRARGGAVVGGEAHGAACVSAQSSRTSRGVPAEHTHAR